MADKAVLSSRPWWIYVRFSLRTLLVLVLLAGVWLGWLVRSVRTQPRGGGRHPTSLKALKSCDSAATGSAMPTLSSSVG